MTDWRGRSEGPDQVKVALVVGVAAGLAVIGWMFAARSGDERVSTSGFSFGGATAAGRTMAPERAAPAATTSLSMVRFGFTDAPGSATPEASGAAAEAPAAPAAPAAPEAPAETPSEGAPASAAPAPPDAVKPAAGELAALGVKDEPKGLARLGAEKGLLSALAAKALEHPAVLRYLLNSKPLVDAYFSRDLVQRNCSSGAALKSYLMNGSDPGGVSEEMSLAKTLLAHPEAAAAAAGTEFGSRLMSCPSVGELSKDPGAVLAIASANPAALGLVADPNAVKALSSNPQALSLLGSAQSALGGGASAPAP